MSVSPMEGVSSGAVVRVQDEGTDLAFKPKINFTGAGVSAAVNGSVIDVTINAGAGGALDDLSDVTITTPATGATLIYNGSAWVDGQLDLADSDARTGTLPIANGGTGTTTALQTMWIPSTAMKARTTNGPGNTTTESTTNKIMRDCLDFDTTTSEYAQFHVRMPKGWDESTVTAAFVWSAASGSGTVIWGIQGIALSDDDAVDTAFGTAQTVTDTLITADDVHITAATSAITIGGTPASEDWVVFQVYRDISDTLGVDARLMGCTLYYTINTYSDA